MQHRCENYVDPSPGSDPAGTGENRVLCNAPGALYCVLCGCWMCKSCAQGYPCTEAPNDEHVLVDQEDYAST